MTLEEFIQKYIKEGQFEPESLLIAKRKFAKETKQALLRNSQLIAAYRRLTETNKLKRCWEFEELLRLKRVRTLSGVSPVAVLTKPYPCPGECVYCPTQKKIPKSYLRDEPAVLRAQSCHFDALKQVKKRIRQYEVTGHTPQKIELIVMGGTWSVLPKDYQIDFISACFAACNQKKIQKLKSKKQNDNLKFKILRREQKKNETAKYRIVGLTLETRPDYINLQEIKLMRELGCTRVELGVQSVYGDVLKKVRRGHLVADTIRATQLLKDAGFKICYQYYAQPTGK